jgi:hypothetical protein
LLLLLSQFTMSFAGSGTITNILRGSIGATAIGLRVRSPLTGIGRFGIGSRALLHLKISSLLTGISIG